MSFRGKNSFKIPFKKMLMGNPSLEASFCGPHLFAIKYNSKFLQDREVTCGLSTFALMIIDKDYLVYN